MVGLIYLFLGIENALKEEALRELKDKTLSGGNPQESGNPDLNYSIFYSDQFDPHAFLDAVNTNPFLSPARFVVIRDIDKLPQETRDPVISYAKNPSESTILVMTAGISPREAAGDPFLSELSKLAKVQNFENLSGESLRRYILGKAALYKKEIGRDAIELLIAKVGNDLQKLRMAIEKLTSYAGEREAIEKKDVEALVGKSLEETVFDMTKAMMSGQASRSLLILSELLRESVRPENIIGAMGAGVKRAARSKGPPDRAKKWLKKSLSYLAEADRDCKNRDLDKRVILESLVVRLSEFSELA